MKYVQFQSQGYPPPTRTVGKGYIHRFIRQGKTMGEVVVGGRITAHSPDSDCNSNHPGSTTSCLSNTSSQDIDFIQDNSDYQWFLDYNYRDGSTNHHTSILSLSEPYDANDVGYYDVLAKNMDANLAEADMESFRTEDIHALLTNLPTMCTDPLSQDHHQGESFASVSGSMMAKFDFDSSISPHSSSSQGEDTANSTSMSICKSELLFSPVKEIPMPGANFSVDSLDCELMNEHDIMLTCQANKDNYTIAFEGSLTMYSEDSDYHESDKSGGMSGSGSIHWEGNMKVHPDNIKLPDTSMAQSDSGGFTTWSKLKKRTSDNQLKRHPSGNNNSSVDSNKYSAVDNVLKSQSMPNLYKQKVKGLMSSGFLRSNTPFNSSIDASKRRAVKVFDIQHQIQTSSLSGGSLVSDMATSADCGSTSSESNKQPNLNLVKLFMKQKSMSAEGMSTAMDQSSVSDNWPTHSVASNESLEDKQSNCIEAKANCLENGVSLSENGSRTHELIIEEQDEDISRSESVEQLSESISKLESVGDSFENEHNQCVKFNVNNNNSIEHKDLRKRKLKAHSTQTRRNNSLGVSLSSDSSSLSSYTADCNERVRNIGKTTGTQIPVHLMNKSMQTSCYIDKSLKAAPYKLNCHNAKDCVKVVQPSFLNKLKKDGETEKPVYILYPNYVLPDLQFLNEKAEDAAKVFLMPQRGPNKTVQPNTRPFSCNDFEALKKKGFDHVRDWESLNFLLPNECRQLLADVPEIAEQANLKSEFTKPSFCTSPPVRRRARPTSCDCAMLHRTGSAETATTFSSSSSTATQPSSGYRGSSTMLLTDSQNSPALTTNFNPLFVYRYDSVTSSEASLMTSERHRSIGTTAPPLPKRSISLSHDHKCREVVPPRPPLPKGILRKSLETAKQYKNEKSKRYSMFETCDDNNAKDNSSKRYSLPDHYYQRHKRLSETEDEGVDAGTSSSSLDEQPEVNFRVPIPPHPKTDILLSHISCDELLQLEEYLKMSGLSSSDPEDLDEQEIIQLRSCVSKFLALKINQDGNEHFGGKKSVSFAEKVNVLPKNNLEMKPPNNSPNASAFSNQRTYQHKTLAEIPICEEGEISPENYSSPQLTPTHVRKQTYDLNQKRLLVTAVTDAVEKVIHHFSPATNQSELITLGDSSLNPACAKIALTNLCPAIYAVLSDGLKPNLETSFGPICNSVWQVVEASAQQGPLTKALNDLVMRINGEDAITEGLVKFNAFVFGLLNVRSLDAWTSYLRTRETVLKKHYNPNSLLLLAHTGGAAVRGLLDTLISALEPLALLPFHFDVLFEYRQLHESLKRIDSYVPSSPTHVKPSSPKTLTPKQWNLMKLANSLQSTSSHSLSDAEEATTVRQCSPENPTLPDLLNTSTSSRSQCKVRPRSCIEPGVLSKPSFRLGEDVTVIAKKRWSGISLTSKLYQAYDRLAREDTEEEYTDSLETYNNRNNRVPSAEKSDSNSSEDASRLRDDGPESLESQAADEKPLNGTRFRKLQEKWEKLSGKDLPCSPPQSPTHANKSKIPRLVTSPVRPPSGIPVPVVSPTTKPSKIAKKVTTPPSGNRKCIGSISRTSIGNNPPKVQVKKPIPNTRTSRLDQQDGPSDVLKHSPRPSSLPYKPANVQSKNNKLTPPRRAVSSSLGRKPVVQVQSSRVVRTLSHRLASESGHLSYNEGERLTVILEVDEKWLLCCRGTQKGLVPKSAVIADSGRF
ncbi:uncharacterized protein LOC116163770 isoform X2 [Photinus pyralis]|uniref:uncharacterized protein LOC116163770 isoform X2 n=1 Tax=Photinus pyralis TaxID=7054 RepID=UPI0012670066|nr:uncharacterized protein LOC116163770 isoform X2 [Photinus pyralis]